MERKTHYVTKEEIIEDLKFFVKDCYLAEYTIEADGLTIMFSNGEKFKIVITKE